LLQAAVVVRQTLEQAVAAVVCVAQSALQAAAVH
jgi:hypothetical protein